MEENNTIETMQETVETEGGETSNTVSVEEFMSMFEFAPVQLDAKELITTEFFRGVNDGVYWSGFYTALINSGMSVEHAYNMAINKMTADSNYRVAKDNNKASIEISKQKAEMIEGMEF